jgi:hypothetical protein
MSLFLGLVIGDLARNGLSKQAAKQMLAKVTTAC